MSSITSTATTTTTFDLLDRARATLLQACWAQTTTDRYCAAHLAALRAAAALISARMNRRAPLGHAWSHLATLAPEFSEWADYFSLAGERRLQFESGAGTALQREADDLLRAAETFHGLILAALGLPLEFSPDASALAAVVRG
ncbi:SAV_6107 family HEPN domain-containing protein [Gephyromycinifex aptenodytis]|uniref:SAV_6107 family HEPN domain-containing protein n=1 Tax=Gephyromycinifex aptenodytis TaxID=2716227 RepID=UPI0014473DD5|nr:SAV_6107 family HEPN domain-containing protein [Gephyromycinifex aptenodytis]